jgi:site-specific DNA-methyltransferase (adenine-specific)
MDLMPCYPDKFFSLAIVDPPYGHAMTKENYRGRNHTRFGGTFDKYGKMRISRTGGTWQTKYEGRITQWDIAPGPGYFKELFRVADKVIIWGGNYFNLPPSRNFVVWRKLTISESFSMAMVEYAWTNIWGNAKYYECQPQDKYRFHPTQKPAALYRKLLSWYAKPGDIILDTHLGSGTHAKACLDMGLDLIACEIDEFYYSKSIDMLTDYLAQGILPLGSPAIEEKGLFE